MGENKTKSNIGSFFLAIGITLILAPLILYLIKILAENGITTERDLVINVLIALLTFVVTLFTIISFKLTNIQKQVSSTLQEKLDESKLFITQILEKELSNKIYRKLVSTNAVIENNNHRISITAKKIYDFPDKKFYENSVTQPGKTETIDIVRFFSYQDFIFTPDYLNYLFFKHNNSKSTKKIIVVHDPHCQATIAFAYLCFKIGYETALISSKKFKEFYVKKLSEPRHTKENKNKERLVMIKGNPFMYKCENSYGGKYTNYQKKIENNGEIITIPNDIDYWNILENLYQNSHEINTENDLLVDSLETILMNNERASLK